jgi:hypothetical protein
VAVDHDPAGEIGTVYVGTAVGVWKGELDDAGPPPQWDWTELTNGLPEAAVQDLSVVHYGDRTILRAAVQARGVWELELAAGTPAPHTYLRSWTFDGRRGASSTAAADFPQPAFDPGSPTDWTRSPDVSVRPAPGSMPQPPTFPVTKNRHPPEELWPFQTALHAVDPACRPTASWTKAFGRRLEVFRKTHNVGGNPVPANLLQVIDADVWGQVVDAAHVFAPMWDGVEPTEADLLELVQLDHAGNGETRVPAARLNVDVLVHHRDSRPVDASKVRVTLLQRDVSGPAKPWESARIEADACAAVTSALIAVPPASMPAPWSYADSASRVLSPSTGVDARTPRPVSFTFDATALAGQTILLLAVISTDDEAVALSPGVVGDLARSDAHLAARVLRVR